MKYQFALALSVMFLGLSCNDFDEINLNGDWELEEHIDSAIDGPTKRFRIENDSILISTYRSYFDVGEGRIFKDSRTVFVATGHEIKQYHLTEFGNTTMVFTAVDDPSIRHKVRKVDPTRESRLMTYLNASSKIELPLSDANTTCESIEARFRLELVATQSDVHNGENKYKLNNQEVKLSKFEDFNLGYERHKAKTLPDLRKNISPIIYANKTLNAADLDSIKAIFSTLGFDTLFFAKLDLSVNDIDDFPVCFEAVEIRPNNVFIKISESYNRYLCSDTIIINTFEKIYDWQNSLYEALMCK